ncbi:MULTISPECIES: hypothetical protein [unclassified Massilia]|uniref:hypothetical protein n=1 Tax=unclassified Massilia TaxID=2609279 RepID=UPI0017840300|nr:MULTISPECIES: hypothetical protein [unclassified Massilia]MBD8531877.1 hypothetical protein [Massilia sp. CFBP 13647]MBD8675322.1 hypothetical protein [Massilia sp. CFBP 13721]
MFFKKSEKVEKLDDTVAAVFWGASDRMICCKGIEGETNEFNITSHPKLAQQGYVATLEISTAQGEPALLLHAFYSGHWSFAVSPAAEDADELPAWKMTREWGSVNAHSETLTVFCPAGCTVSAVDRIADHY